MKFTLSWLKTHLETDAPVFEIAETLTKIGLEVEGIEDPAKTLAPFLVAHVVSAEPHPNADRLRVCRVDTGMGDPVQVVCGAPNARAGMKSVFAPPGSTIPGSAMTLSIGTIRGVESRGMLCSAAELGLPGGAEGILDLPPAAPVGQAYAAFAGLDDPVIDINLTPNRADCTSIYGIARDLAAAGVGVLRSDIVRPIRGAAPCPVGVTLDLDPRDAHLAPFFALRLVSGVANGESPVWMQKRLRAIGLRPINALVDITNYMTFDRGRPLHVFDAAKVKGSLTVRLARPGETLDALDGKQYRLDEESVVIADESGVISLGGIMGGAGTGCDEHTRDVLVESALWEASNIARTGRKLGINSDARYRFERGVDPTFALPGLDLATQMIVEISGGTPSSAHLAGDIPDYGLVIDFPWSEIKRLSGFEIPRPEAKVILTQLGFHVAGMGDRVKIAPPSWRADVTGKADIVEELIRIAGIDQIEPKPLERLPSSVALSGLSVLQKRIRQAKRLLADRGMLEAMTWSFVSKSEAKLFGGGDPKLALANPIAADLSDMRPSLLPGLLRAMQRNVDRGFSDLALFEVGQVFLSDEIEGQFIKAAGIRRGLERASGAGRHWRGSEVADVFDVKGDVLNVLEGLGIAGVQVVEGGPEWLHPGRCGTLQFGPRGIVGFFGEMHPRLLKRLDIKGPVLAFEMILDALPLSKARGPSKSKLKVSEFQPVTRDFAFKADRHMPVGDLLKAAQNAERGLIADVALFDLYEGPGIEKGYKSVAIAVTLKPDKTLTETEIETVSQRIVMEVEKKTSARLRL